MKLYRATIKSNSNFATTLKGDTIFGHICWSIHHIFGEQRLKELLKEYEKKPFLVVSDGFVSGYLPKPKLPSFLLGEDPDKKKENRKKIWMKREDFFGAKFEKAKELKNLKEKNIQIVRNTINYKLNRTDGDSFSPYEVGEYSFAKKDIYFLLDDAFGFDELSVVLKFMGIDGFGKDKSIGKGKFDMVELEEFGVKNKPSKFFMSLSPISLQGIKQKVYYDTFVKFGKLGGSRAFGNVFKKPIIFGDTATVIEFEKETLLEKLYLGKAIADISNYDDVVHQGYSIVLPFGKRDE